MIDLDAVLRAHEQAVHAFAGLLRTARADMPIPHLEWNAGELGAHVLTGIREYRRAALDNEDVWATLRDGPAENARYLAQTPERDPQVVAERLEAEEGPLLEVWRAADGPVRWSGGLSLRVEVVAGILVADVLVHGWDLNRATRSRWDIPREHAALALLALAEVAPHFVAPDAGGFAGRYEVRLRGHGKLFWSFDHGRLTVAPDDSGPVDCRIHADPATFLLMAYGRVPVWRASMTGRVMASGGKPWLAPRFKSLLVNP